MPDFVNVHSHPDEQYSQVAGHRKEHLSEILRFDAYFLKVEALDVAKPLVQGPDVGTVDKQGFCLFLLFGREAVGYGKGHYGRHSKSKLGCHNQTDVEQTAYLAGSILAFAWIFLDAEFHGAAQQRGFASFNEGFDGCKQPAVFLRGEAAVVG